MVTVAGAPARHLVEGCHPITWLSRYPWVEALQFDSEAFAGDLNPMATAVREADRAAPTVSSRSRALAASSKSSGMRGLHPVASSFPRQCRGELAA
jgi:hypothetical protein